MEFRLRYGDGVLVVEPKLNMFYWNWDNSIPDAPRVPEFSIEYFEQGTGDPYGELSFTQNNMGFLPMRNAAYLEEDDVGFRGQFMEQLIERGLAYPTGVSNNMGPLWVFKERFLKDIGGKDYLKYVEEYKRFVELYGVGYEPKVPDEFLEELNNCQRDECESV